MSEQSNKTTELGKESKPLLDKIFKDWAEQGEADSAGFSNDGLVTIERSSGKSLPHESTDFFKCITGMRIVESTIPSSWFEAFQAMENLEWVEFESCKKLPTGSVLPPQVTYLSLKRLDPAQVPGILYQQGKRLEGLSIEEFVFDLPVFELVRGMNNLKELRLVGTNPLGDLGEKTLLKSIHLSQLKLTDAFKEWVYNLKGLRKVELWGTRFDRLPPSLIAEAEELTVYLSEIQELPPGKLNNLRHLIVSNVAVSELPAGYLPTGLVSLDLSRTEIRKLPDEIQGLKNLKRLNLADSEIKELPSKMACSASLERLDISNTKLKRVPEWLAKTANLNFFGLAGCQLEEIGENVSLHLIAQFSSMIHDAIGDWRKQNQKGMFIRGVTIKTMDARLLSLKNAHEVLGYYFSRGRKPAHEVRLFVLGEEADRKAVFRKLLDEPEIMDEAVVAGGMSLWEITAKTLGRSGLRGDNLRLDSDARIHVYEMGEQDSYQSAHPMFFSDLSLYLVVLRAALGARLLAQAQYWSNLVGLKAPNSSLIFCIVEDEEGGLFNAEVLKQNLKLPQSINSQSIKYNADGEGADFGVSELKSLLIREVQQMPAYTWEIPLAWSNIKRHVETLLKTHPVISNKQFEDICRYYHGNVPTDNLLGPLVTWLKETGVLFTPTRDKDRALPPGELPDNLYDVGWLAACTYGVLRYAKTLGGETTTRAIWREAEAAEDESFMATRFLNRSRSVMKEMVRAGLCLEMEQGDAPSLYLYPLFRESGPLPEPASRKNGATSRDRDAMKKWLVAAATPIAMTKTHYVIRCAVISEAFLAAFLLETYLGYRNWLERNIKNPSRVFSLVGREGVLVAFPPKDDTRDKDGDEDVPRSGSLLVTGLVGSPAEIHIYASGTICPLLPGAKKWEKARSFQILDYASIALKAFDKTLQDQSTLQSRAEKFTVFVEEELGKDRALIPLEDIKNFREMKRSEYYCAPLNKTLVVRRAYEIYHPNSITD